VVNAHLWEFPNEEVTRAGTRIPGFTSKQLTPLCTVKHSITRYRITLDAFYVRPGRRSFALSWTAKRPGTPFVETGVWKTPAQMKRLAFCAAHKRILLELNGKEC
jgi:hypothetical protein